MTGTEPLSRWDLLPDDEITLVPVDPRPAKAAGGAVLGGQRLPVLPPWARNSAEFAAAARWATSWIAHATAFHTVRIPVYGGRLVGRSPRGAARVVGGVWRWVTDAESAELRGKADERTYVALAGIHDTRVKTRLWGAGIGAVVLTAGSVAGWLLSTPLQHWSGVAVTVAALGLAGRQKDRPLLSRAVVVTRPQRLTAEIVVRGLVSLGGEIASAVKRNAGAISFPAPITRDGPGWLATIDLPHGVTATEVMEKRAELASGLRRPLGCVWPESDAATHPGRLLLWVGDADLSRAKPIPWPLVDRGIVDLFEPILFGLDPRGRQVFLTLMFASMVIGSVPRMGKALALDTPVPTPSGLSTMGDLRDGDTVFDEAGLPCRVLRAHAVRHDRPCYEVEFSDGSVIVADAEHLWQVETRSTRVNGRPEKVLTTEEMVGRVRVEADRRVNYSVRAAGALQMPDASLPVAPYTLGAWLGDGTSIRAHVTTVDPEILGEIEREGYPTRVVPSTVTSGRAPTYHVAGLYRQLNAAGLLGAKRIPEVYFRASEAQRRALLAGLLDTDGWCEKWGSVRFVSTQIGLAEDFRRLVATLGYVSTMRSRPARLDGRDCGTVYEITFCPNVPVFRLPRKTDRQSTKNKTSNKRRFIVDIRPVASVPVRCITVDSPSSLYLVGEQCIPTHNTFSARLLLLAAALHVTAELHAFDLKGTGDFQVAEPVCHRYRAGDEDDDIEYGLADLRELRAEMRRRTKVIRGLPRTLCPESKVTPQIAAMRELRMHPIFIVVDECQRWFEHKEHGEELESIAEDLVRRGPALGIIAVFATQRPDAKSLPAGISSNAIVRFALKVVGHIPNDMVLGTGAFKSGIKATMFSRKDLGIGWLSGEEDEPQIVRTCYVDNPTSERVIARAIELRRAAGTLPAEDDREPAATYDLFADLAECWPGGGEVWSERLVAALAELRPDVYAGWTPEQLAKAVTPLKTHQIWDGEQKANRRGLARDEVVEMAARRRLTRSGGDAH